eukprot:12081295-Ditylum_brightwellii.AAC.1
MLLALTIPHGVDSNFNTPNRTTASHLARKYYLLYDLMTSIVWVAQITAPFFFIGPSAFPNQPLWLIKINIAACLYSVAISLFNFIVDWEARDDVSDLISACVVNIVFFSGFMQSEYKRIQKNGYECSKEKERNAPNNEKYPLLLDV